MASVMWPHPVDEIHSTASPWWWGRWRGVSHRHGRMPLGANRVRLGSGAHTEAQYLVLFFPRGSLRAYNGCLCEQALSARRRSITLKQTNCRKGLCEGALSACRRSITLKWGNCWREVFEQALSACRWSIILKWDNYRKGVRERALSAHKRRSHWSEATVWEGHVSKPCLPVERASHRSEATAWKGRVSNPCPHIKEHHIEARQRLERGAWASLVGHCARDPFSPTYPTSLLLI